MSKHSRVDVLASGHHRDQGRCRERSGICFCERHESTRRKPPSTLVLQRDPFYCWAKHTIFLPMKSFCSFSRTKICCRIFALVLVAATLAWPRSTSAAAFECNDNGWEGTSELLSVARTVAGAARVRLVAELDYGALTPEDSVLVLHPDVILDDISLSAFVQLGGRVAVLDDFGKSTSFAERFGIMRVQAPIDPQNMLRNNRQLSVGTPVEMPAADGTPQRHPLVRDADRVVLNHPAGLTNPGLTPVLELRTKGGTAVPIALTGVVGSEQKGRLLVMSDPSAFINLMIRYPGNLAFASAIIRYLTEDEGRAGKGHLFIVANRFEQTGRFSRRHGPLADIVEGIEHLARELQSGFPPALLIALAAVAALGIAQWISKHALHKPAPAVPRFLRPVPLVAQAGWPGRAAVLLAPTTHVALLLVELREAFRARLAQLISADAAASNHALVAIIESRSLLPPDLLRSLHSLLAEVDAAERAVVARKPIRIRRATLGRLLEQSLDILDHISQSEPHHRESSPPSQ
jgi:hypothetical protein